MKGVDKMTTGIYKITNLTNGKIYIGQSVHIERRWEEHCRPSASSLISSAIKKYGIKNFSFEIIEVCQKSKLNERESHWIKYYNSLTPRGYNVEDNTESDHSLYSHFSKDELLNILKELQFTKLTLSEIAKKHNLSVSTISRINSGEIHHLDNINYPIRNSNRTNKTKNYCIDCGKQISSGSQRCVNCENKRRLKTDLPINRETLKQMIRIMPFTTIAKHFSVSDNTIRKWCDKYNLPRKASEIKKISDKEWAKL